MAKNLTIDAGRVHYAIYDTDGNEYASIDFNPGDTGIATRGQRALTKINETIERLKAADQDKELSMDDICKAEDEAVSAFKYMLGASAKTDIFDKVSPFTELESGKLFIEEVITAITPEIQEGIKNTVGKRRQDMMEKYGDSIPSNRG